ncbi:MAG: methyltransferase domain-containing protein [Mariprofundaceae bacterium]|nr:methyltransferase domain-containing protein [Mariprofundaceae bacterium]
MNQETVWEALYQQGDTGWDRGEISPALTHWLASGLHKDQRILIPGCGRGHEVLELASLGFDVTALDMAPTAIEALNRVLTAKGLQATVICGDLFDYEPEQAFDAIYEQTCLCALHPKQRQAYADKIEHWLQVDGKLYFSMMQTGEEGGPPYHCDWLDMQKLFSSNQWQWMDTAPTIIPRPKGKRYELAFLLRKKPSR